jgi:hypothetical protein
VLTTNDLKRRPAQRRNHLPEFSPTGCSLAAATPLECGEGRLGGVRDEGVVGPRVG